MRTLINTVLTISVLVVLSGCSALTKTIYVDKPVPYTHAPLGLTAPDPLVLHNVSVILVTPEGEKPYFMIDPDSYKNLILNNKKIEGYINDANGRIDACEAYYTKPIE